MQMFFAIFSRKTEIYYTIFSRISKMFGGIIDWKYGIEK